MTALRPNRKTMRKSGFDYTTPGWYFLTICTYRRQLLFEDERLRQVVWYGWLDLRNKFGHLDLDSFVVMPNHLHGIVILDEAPAPIEVGEGVRPFTAADLRIHRTPSPTADGAESLRHGIPAIVRQFKNRTARRINQLRLSPGTPVWQRSYWDRIPRSENGIERVRRYIAENPVRWEFDPENPLGKRDQHEETFWKMLRRSHVLQQGEG